MNAVEGKNDALRIAVGAAILGCAGVFVASIVGHLPRAQLSAAFADEAGAQATVRPDCAGLAPPGQRWHGVDVAFEGAAPASARVGSAGVSATPSVGPASTLEWHADLGVDAVIIQTGAQSRTQRFDRERFDGAHRPAGDPPPEKLTLCYDLELTINKDTNPKLTRVYNWKIDETVEPAHWQLAPGDAGVSTYRVSVERDDGTDRGWRVDGTITIDNLTPKDVAIARVEDVTEDGVVSRVDCGVRLPGYVLASGESLTCEYRTDLPDGSAREASARVFTGANEEVQGASVTSRIDFVRAEVQEVGKSVFVTDTDGRAWTFHQSGTSVYERTFRCESDAGLHPSAVRIDGTNERSSSAVSVDCQPAGGDQTAARPKER